METGPIVPSALMFFSEYWNCFVCCWRLIYVNVTFITFLASNRLWRSSKHLSLLNYVYLPISRKLDFSLCHLNYVYSVLFKLLLGSWCIWCFPPELQLLDGECFSIQATTLCRVAAFLLATWSFIYINSCAFHYANPRSRHRPRQSRTLEFLAQVGNFLKCVHHFRSLRTVLLHEYSPLGLQVSDSQCDSYYFVHSGTLLGFWIAKIFVGSIERSWSFGRIPTASQTQQGQDKIRFNWTWTS